MSLAQLHYTSAPPGPDGSGFRFTAVSPGVPVSLLREAEQLIGYEPPRDAPARPGPEQLRAFPQALSLNVLADGSRLLARSVYTGADYSGRWGNFHAHAVHLPQPAGPDRPAEGPLPITSWGSPQWADESPPPGAPLPPLASVPVPGPLDREALAAFVAARGPWLAGFFADVRRLGEDPAAPQIVVVEPDSEAAARWIMLACSVLPHQRGQWLTFTTYTRRPQLARQQIIGVLPDDGPGLAGQEHRYRVYDAARAAAPVPAPDAWAQTAARVWRAGRQELFAEVRRLSPDPYAAGPLAALALAAGVPLDRLGRAAAADWAAGHREALDGGRLHALAAALGRPADGSGYGGPGAGRVGGAGPGEGPGAGPGEGAGAGPGEGAGEGDEQAEAAEAAACGRLLAALAGWAPVAVTEPLAALALARAVRSGGAAPPAGLLGEAARLRLGAELEPELRAALTDPQRGPADRVGLLRAGAGLGIDSTDVLPEVARHLARALVADPEGTYGEPVRSALDGMPGLRALVLDRLDGLAAGDPAAAARLFARTPLRLAAGDALPHLRMCARGAEPGGDRVRALTDLVQAAGVPLEAEPLVLRTAMRLVWPEGAPGAHEAWLVLTATGPGPHREAGTWELLARAAVDAPAEDRAAEELAPELLRYFAAELPSPLRPSLLMLELARNLRAGTAGPGWVRQALDLGTLKPSPTARDHAYGAVAARLLAVEDRPESELRALIESNDAALLAAYRRAAREPRTVDRLRLDPRYAAECFATWSSQPQAGAVWQEARTDLLDGVMRPVVRGLPPDGLAALEEALGRLGGRWQQEFRSWQRPGAFGRLRDRFTGAGRGTRRAAKGGGPGGAPAAPPPRGGGGGPIVPGSPAVPPGTAGRDGDGHGDGHLHGDDRTTGDGKAGYGKGGQLP
ncbi:GTPase-associated protein 1-related protein [Streptomyces sp. NPDC007369]|uniref:GTPase-associated protein 1-related protein n=1 Tax=Streptomyces sp. NPDC007369 TaxID=3154589 RepID=UPI0033DB3F00